MKHSQQGFALIAAIILVVILAGLSAFVASMVSGQSANQQLERMTRVADLAAQAGLEWGAYRAVQQSICAPTTTLPVNTLPGALAAMTVTVTCSGASPYSITSTAKVNGVPITNPDYVERTKSGSF
jgi:type II secretory pathway pseudopilin PulG